MIAISQPFPQFFEADGSPLDNGYIYFGVANLDPQTNPIAIYWDAAGTIPASNPVRTLNGYIVNGSTPSQLYVNASYSMRFKSAGGVTLFSVADSSYSVTNGILTEFSNTASASKGAGLIGFNYSLGYAAGTIGKWLKDLATSAGSTLIGFLQAGSGAVLSTLQTESRRNVYVGQFGAKGDGTTDDTAAIVAANTYARSVGKTLRFDAGTYIYKPTAPMECGMWAGESSEATIIRVDCSLYTGSQVVFRLTKKSEWQNLSVYEKNASRTNGILVQLSDTTAGTGAGGVNAFSAYTNLRRVWLFGGLIALDVGNMFTCRIDSCLFRQAGTGVRIVPTDDAGDNGYANTITFADCEVSENNQNWLVNTAGGPLNGLLVLGGSTERAVVSGSVFTNLRHANFVGHYVEQNVLLTPLAFSGCSGVFLKLAMVGQTLGTLDISIGTNTEAVIEGVSNGFCRVIGADGTQTVTLRNCALASTGNSALSNWSRVTLENSSYSGTFYASKILKAGSPLLPLTQGAFPVIASASTIAPTSPVQFVSGVTTINTITPPTDVASQGGYLTLIPSGAWSTSTAGNIALASTGVVNKALTMYYDTGSAKWIPSY